MSIYAYLAAAALAIAIIFGANWKGKVDGRAERAAEVAVLEARGRDKDAQIEAQNAAVAALKADADRRIAAAAAALKTAQAATATAQVNAARILALKSGPHACADAEALIAREMGK